MPSPGFVFFAFDADFLLSPTDRGGIFGEERPGLETRFFFFTMSEFLSL
jgi:hypothetical protein